jgi:hypothetical protein
VSLKSLQKKVKGATGRNAATGVSEFKSWAAFEDEASKIWKNAYIYNEDGSAIFLLAKELEVGLENVDESCTLLTEYRPSSRKSLIKLGRLCLNLLAQRSS